MIEEIGGKMVELVEARSLPKKVAIGRQAGVHALCVCPGHISMTWARSSLRWHMQPLEVLMGRK